MEFYEEIRKVLGERRKVGKSSITGKYLRGKGKEGDYDELRV